MADLWLISVPLDKTSITSVEKLKHTIAKTDLASYFMFPIPDLKEGILDSLLILSDDLTHVDTLTESVIKNVCQCLRDVTEGSSDEVLGNGLVNGVDLLKYITRFQWDNAKYPTAMPLSYLKDLINKNVLQVAKELKSQTAIYNKMKTNLQALQRKRHGMLQNRSLNEIVQKEDLVVSEYLTTLLVLVPRGSYFHWESTYECLSELVVPRTSRKLLEDEEGGIFTVTLFKRAVWEFKAKAQESKFLVLEYCFDLEEKMQEEKNQLTVHQKEQHRVFVHWLKIHFSELFVAWIHLKALRVFVESALRYGLPVRYQALLLQTDMKRSKKLEDELSSLFMHLDPTAMASKAEIGSDIPGLCGQEYLSYICFHINTNML